MTRWPGTPRKTATGRWKAIVVLALVGAGLAAAGNFLLRLDPITGSSISVRNLTSEPLRDLVVIFPSHSERRAALAPGESLFVHGRSAARQGDWGAKLGFTYRGRRHEEEDGYVTRGMDAQHCDAEVVGDEVRGGCCKAGPWPGRRECAKRRR